MHGDCGPGGELFTPPIRTEHPGGDRLSPDPATDSLLVLGPGGEVRQTIPNFHVSSAPWAVAGFSADGVALVAADPRGVRLFRYVPAKGGEKPRWTAAGGAADHRALFRAVLANPDEDVPRLMYADWLEEHGDAARAEFIRVQCRLAERMRDEVIPVSDPEYVRANEQARLLGPRWMAELPVLRGVHWTGFRRGFPGVSVVSPTTLSRSGPKVWGAAPVEMVAVTGLNQTGANALAASPFFGRVRVLTVESYYAGRDGIGPIRTLLRSPRVAGLRRLSFSYSHLTPETVAEVVDSPRLTGLEWVSLTGGSAFGDEHADALLDSPAFANLRGGVFRSSRLGKAAQKRLLARWPKAVV
jgi:uncharacterized protein (TIGR02996 family)